MSVSVCGKGKKTNNGDHQCVSRRIQLWHIVRGYHVCRQRESARSKGEVWRREKKNAEQAFWKGLTGEARDIKKIDMHIDQLHMRCEVELTSKQSHLGARERDLPLVGVCWCGVVRVEA